MSEVNLATDERCSDACEDGLLSLKMQKREIFDLQVIYSEQFCFNAMAKVLDCGVDRR